MLQQLKMLTLSSWKELNCINGTKNVIMIRQLTEWSTVEAMYLNSEMYEYKEKKATCIFLFKKKN